MLLPEEVEPISSAAISEWIRLNISSRDPFRGVYAASEGHRLEHGQECDVYPSSSGPTLGALVAATGAKRILEVGCGLGYSALWLAASSVPGGNVDTCEKDPVHAALARAQFERAGFSSRIAVHEGRAIETLALMDGPYDFIFADGDPDEYPDDLDHFLRLLTAGGTLITSNLFLGVHVPDAPYLARAAEYRRRILDEPRLSTAFFPDGKAFSVKRA